MKINIISTGSKGNCVVVDECIMIDAGASTPTAGIHTLLLTHMHGDHTAYLRDYAHIETYTASWVVDSIKCKFQGVAISGVLFDAFVSGNNTNGIADDFYRIIPVEAKHDIPCCGWIIEKDDEAILYATDFSELEGVDLSRMDAIFVECNNTLHASDIVEASIGDVLPKDSFHRRRSWNTHSRATYLREYFLKHSYNGAPVVLLHKSASNYARHPEDIEALCKVVNIVNPESENIKNRIFDTKLCSFI